MFLVSFGVGVSFSGDIEDEEIISHLDKLAIKLEQRLDKGIAKKSFDFFPFYAKNFELTVVEEDFEKPVSYLMNLNPQEIKRLPKAVSLRFRRVINSSNPEFGFYFFKRIIYLCNKSNRCKPGQFISNVLPRVFNEYITNPTILDSGVFSFKDALLIHNFTRPTLGDGWIKDRKLRYKNNQFLDYRRINRATRMSLAYQVQLDTQQAIKKLPNFRGIVYSGQLTRPGAKNVLKKGQEVCYNGFLSTSQIELEAKFYAEGLNSKYIFKIQSQTGKDISDFSSIRGEQEVLFPPYQRFLILSDPLVKLNDSDLLIVEMKEIPNIKGMPCYDFTDGTKIIPN
jgi:hypothetical protein